LRTYYTDGACVRNGKPDSFGAWAWVADDGDELCGVEHGTTSNRMELRAVIEALRHAAGDEPVTIYTDSLVTAGCASGKYRRSKNTDLWAEYEAARAGRDVRVEWVRGHAGNAQNERADALCAEAMLDAESPDADALRDIAQR
jgi:ribonuclease HI